MGLGSAVAVFQSDDIVFPQVIPDLNLDELHQFLSLVRQGVFFLQGNVNRLVDFYRLRDFSDCHRGLALDDCPVFGAVVVVLEGQFVAGID